MTHIITRAIIQAPLAVPVVGAAMRGDREVVAATAGSEIATRNPIGEENCLLSGAAPKRKAERAQCAPVM